MATTRTISPAPEGQLIRGFGLWGLAALILNGIIGAGIFALPGSVAQFAGSWAPLVILGVGLAFLPVVLLFAALAGLFDETGGPIIYVREAFGLTAGFQAGWVQCLATTAASAANANVLADYVLRLAPAGWSGALAHGAVVLAAIGLAFAVNLLEVRNSDRWIKLISVAKLLPLFLLAGLALPAVAYGPALLPASEWSLAQAILLSVYAFTGFEGALCLGGEAHDPQRDFPRALVGVFLATVALYSALAWGYVAIAYAPGAADKASLLTMATVLAGAIGAGVIVCTAVMSILGNVITTPMNTSRRLLALEQIGTLPRWFGVIHPGSGIPRNAVVFTYAVALLLAMSGGFAVLAVLSVAARLVVYLACAAALPVVRRRRGLPVSAGMTVTVAAALAICLLLIAQSDLKAWASLAAAVAIGFVIKWIAAQAIAPEGAAAG
ncbi:MAG: APC family permease [Novosphingobium sp.]|uniref:APC family permease n=1 Tax=Novosphingobium sp. TaxID=1874826 RepID=UPI003018CA36